MKIELSHLAAGLFVGGALGFAYFGGLWLTVCRAVPARRSRSLLALSTLLRLAAALGVFYGLLHLSPIALATGMLAFVAVRQGWLRKVGEIAK